MKYKSDNLYNYEQKSWWIFEIFKNIRHIENKPRNFYKNEWFEFHPLKWGVHTTLEKAGYFDERPQLDFYVSQLLGILLIPFLIFNFSWWFLLLTLVLSLGGIGKIYLNLPFKTGINECESPKWGFYLYTHDGFNDLHFVIHLGEKSKWFNFPWNFEWYRTSYLESWEPNQPKVWITERKGQRKDFWKEEWENKLYEESWPYTYTLKSGEVQERTATLKVVEREWRRRWLMWTTLFNRVIRTIDVQFNDEVGEQSGSWKGGVLGCGYEIKEGESPVDTLRRMERERKF